MFTGEPAEGVRRGSLKGAGVASFSVAVDDGVLSAGFAGAMGLNFSAPAVVATSSDDLADTGVAGSSERIGGNVIDFVGVGVLSFSVSTTVGLERLIDAALTAADLGRGCTGVLVTDELGDGKSIDLAELIDETRFSGADAMEETRFSDTEAIEEIRFSGSGVATVTVFSGALDFGLRLFGPLARLLVMCVS